MKQFFHFSVQYLFSLLNIIFIFSRKQGQSKMFDLKGKEKPGSSDKELYHNFLPWQFIFSNKKYIELEMVTMC